MSTGVPASATPLSVLIIDSNVFFAKRLAQALREEGFEVQHATQSAYALTMLEYTPPDAILCATNLRELNAFELPKIVHADPKTANIPVLAIGDGSDQALMEAFRAGCDDYIDRRLGAGNIASHLRSFLRSRNEGFHPTQMLESQQTALEGNLSHLDLPGVIQMLGHSRQSGALHINAKQLDGIIFFDNGEVVHAEFGDIIGDEAVVGIIKGCNDQVEGVYKFVPGSTSTTRTVLRSVTELMLDALREIDEEARGGEGELL
jgi:CheY-like chemotaxis protein